MNAQRHWPFIDASILIVEDAPLIALDVHAALSMMGATLQNCEPQRTRHARA